MRGGELDVESGSERRGCSMRRLESVQSVPAADADRRDPLISTIPVIPMRVIRPAARPLVAVALPQRFVDGVAWDEV